MKFTMALLQCRYNRVFTSFTGHPVEIDKKKIWKLIKRMQRRKEADHNKKRLPCKMTSLEWFLADAIFLQLHFAFLEHIPPILRPRLTSFDPKTLRDRRRAPTDLL